MKEPTFYNAELLEWIAGYDGEKFHACLCDPPYHLTSIVKRFANGEPEHTKTANDIKHRLTPHARQAAGFMGKRWDGGDIAFRPETWAAIASLLHPGAFIFAFAGTRGWHRQAVAMEDAGLIFHPSIFYLFGSGFPKATRIDTQIDKAAGAEREIVGANPNNRPNCAGKQTRAMSGPVTVQPITEPATDLAKAWAGHRYGLQAMKPAAEVILVAQVPYSGKPVDCITRTGAGALNIGAGRVTSGKEYTENAVTQGINTARTSYSVTSTRRKFAPEQLGRWPSNVILEKGEIAEALDAQSGVSVSKSGGLSGSDPGMWAGKRQSLRLGHDDLGGASRFFYQTDWNAETAEALASEVPFRYQAKAGRAERDAGLVGMPLKADIRINAPRDCEGEKFSPSRNTHPTLKPVRLTRYLASLLLPPAEYAPRRLLVPFAGAGSEAIGAMLAGWEDVVGVEMTEEYVEIARARAKFWAGNSGLFDSLTENEEEAAAQGSLFGEEEEE